MDTFKRILLYFLCFTFFYVEAQELPPVENFTPDIYGAENQNWAITQSNEKYIYIANNSGLLEYNGAKWKLYPSPNNTIMRSVMADGDRIYSGCYMEFGYWERNEVGGLFYTSLSSKLTTQMIEDEQFWNIFKIENWLLFQSLNRIYIYNVTTNEFSYINSNTTLTKIFNVEGDVYFQKLNEGVYKIENGKDIKVSDNIILKENTIVNMFSIDNKILIQTQMEGFYYLTEGKLTKWNIPADEILSKVSVYSSIRLKDNSIILGTISNGIYQLNDKGEILLNINQEKGLNNNTVLSIFEDIDKNVWLALDNGISVLNFNSTFKVYEDINGKLGTVYALEKHNNYLYLGTNQGLYYKKINTQNDFNLLPGTNGQVWCLKVIDNTLFCGHNVGTFVIENNEAKLVSNVMGTWDIKPIKEKDNLLLQGNYDGLYVLEKVKNNWELKNKIDGFGISSKFFEFADKNTLFVNHEYEGVYKISINDDFTKANQYSTEKSVKKGLKSSLVSYNGKLLYTSKEGVFEYNNSQKKFEKDTLLTTKLFHNDEYVSGKLIANSETNTLWGFTNKNVVYFSLGKFNSTPKVNRLLFPTSIRKGFAGYESITHLKDKIFILGSSKGYVVLDLDKIQNKDYEIKITSIQKSNVKSENKEVQIANENTFEFKENNLNISYSVPEFEAFTQTLYQYKLEGLYDEWSEWNEASEVSFKNLPFGSYKFKVRAQVGNNLTSNSASYNFTILRPWYISNKMILVYTFFIIGLFILTHNLYKRYYTNQKQKLIEKKQRQFELSQLESEKLIMKLKNEKLQNEIESKTRELALSTINITKKNQILTKIKKQLTEGGDDKNIKTVVRMINKNITDTNDWDKFQEAFNNADSDFLKKIKTLHKNLTPNDLRLCAYLRLNLSSKEIAPLLNISPRSVEIKRYRLRKKINLPHKKSLVEYILEI